MVQSSLTNTSVMVPTAVAVNYTVIIHAGEENHGVWNSGARWNQNGVVSSKEIQLLTQIKLVRYGVARYIQLT